MQTSNFSKYIFWSYKSNANLPDKVIIEQVALHGEMEDLKKLTKLYPREVLLNVLDSIKNKNSKRVNFISKVLLS